MRAFAGSAATALATAQTVEAEQLRMSIASADQERRRWARELHDETLQGLGALQVMLTAALSAGRTEPLERRPSRRSNSIETQIEELQGLITELRPAALDDIGLGAGARRASSSGRATPHGLTVAPEIDLDYEAGRSGSRLDAGDRRHRLPARPRGADQHRQARGRRPRQRSRRRAEWARSLDRGPRRRAGFRPREATRRLRAGRDARARRARRRRRSSIDSTPGAGTSCAPTCPPAIARPCPSAAEPAERRRGRAAIGPATPRAAAASASISSRADRGAPASAIGSASPRRSASGASSTATRRSIAPAANANENGSRASTCSHEHVGDQRPDRLRRARRDRGPELLARPEAGGLHRDRNAGALRDVLERDREDHEQAQALGLRRVGGADREAPRAGCARAARRTRAPSAARPPRSACPTCTSRSASSRRDTSRKRDARPPARPRPSPDALVERRQQQADDRRHRHQPDRQPPQRGPQRARRGSPSRDTGMAPRPVASAVPLPASASTTPAPCRSPTRRDSWSSA